MIPAVGITNTNNDRLEPNNHPCSSRVISLTPILRATAPKAAEIPIAMLAMTNEVFSPKYRWRQ